MSLLTVLILSSTLFCIFSAILFINIHRSVREMAKTFDGIMATDGSFSGIVGTMTNLVNRGVAKVAIHMVCGFLAAIAGIVAFISGILYLVKTFT